MQQIKNINATKKNKTRNISSRRNHIINIAIILKRNIG